MTEERTEPATPKRRKKAREEGQVARSSELVGSVILLGVLWALPGLAPQMAGKLSTYFLQTVGTLSQGGMSEDGLRYLMGRWLIQVMLLAGPIMGLVAVGALVSNVVQIGFFFNAGQLQPKLSRLDPLAGLKRLLAMRSVVELLKGIVKVAIVVVSGWTYLSDHREGLFQLSATDPARIAPQIGKFAHGMALQMAATLAVLAGFDYAYQRWQWERSLRMTKQEVKDELKESEGRPEIRSRIRQRQREISRRRMMAEVPAASVVITNPTHYAVALKYEMGQGGAPKVVAKGQDLIALRIREIAAAHRVPTVENPPLARSIYRSVDIGQEIPPALYRAVAEVLALVWRAEQSKGE
jgi:flagellar biosynthetic protein FlhB